MPLYGYPVLYTLFVWWFSTGLIIYLDNLPPNTFRWSMLGGTLVFAVCLHRLALVGHDTSVTGAYAAFTYGVLAWGWQEMSFFMGFITGPRKTACPQGCGGWRHFRHGVETCLYHELAIVASAAAIVALTWGAPNQVGTWTFMLLWAMRQSSKLNVFLGVRNLNEQFLPQHLAYLRGYLRCRPMNLLFPVSVSLGTVALVLLVQRATDSASRFQTVGLSFLATMLALAIIEHWFLILPLPFAELWTWLLRLRGGPQAERSRRDSPAIDPAHGLHAAAVGMVGDGEVARAAALGCAVPEAGLQCFEARAATVPA